MYCSVQVEIKSLRMIYGQNLNEFQWCIHPSIMIAVYGYWVDNRRERIIKRDKNSTDIRLTNELDRKSQTIAQYFSQRVDVLPFCR